jgi:hypothetical protein
MKKLLPFVFSLFTISTFSQELNCGVTINTPNLSIADPKIFETLETAIYEFMNDRSWTNDKFEIEERISCELIITLTKEVSSDRFQAQINIQSNRPVFNSDYNTPVFTYVDKDFEFTYAEYQTLEFNENAHLTNLTSVLAYYAYLIIGLDYATFSENGGTPYFLKAQKVVNNAQNASERGWKPYDGLRNRYWFVENMLDAKYKGYREALYKYHRLALDQMYEDVATQVKTVTECLQGISAVNRTNPNSMAIQLFFTAKSEEIINLYSGATPQDKTAAINILNTVDPANSTKYRRILTNK